MLQRVVFELQSCRSLQTMRRPSDGQSRTLLLKGQMLSVVDLQGIVFMCQPLISNVEELESLGLYIAELGMHDARGELVMAGWQHASRLEYSIELQVIQSKEIEQNLQKLDNERRKSEQLLYSMIPRQIAERLKNGENPVNTWESFEHVTILFCYLIGFHQLCSMISPVNLVSCINAVFSTFDSVCDKYAVFKVETLGDAVYMVAGGVPDRRPDHATSVASVAVDLLEKLPSVLIPKNILPDGLQLRMGLHTGGVVAGVIGSRMPQYCLFGDTVNTGSRMQSYSLAGHIHVSEACREHLCTEFYTIQRGHISMKGKGQMKTYWLVGRKCNTDTILQKKVNELKKFSSAAEIEYINPEECFDFRNAESQKPDLLSIKDGFITDTISEDPDFSEVTLSRNNSLSRPSVPAMNNATATHNNSQSVQYHVDATPCSTPTIEYSSNYKPPLLLNNERWFAAARSQVPVKHQAVQTDLSLLSHNGIGKGPKN